jgi:uncharacterized protein
MTKTVLITGASSGLGIEFARLFAADGYDLVLVARRRERMQALADELRAAHRVEAHIMAADLAQPDTPVRIAGELEESGTHLDALVNNAGFGSNGPFAENDAAREFEMIEVNVAALVKLTRLLLPGMLARRSGRILNIGSTAGFQPGPFMAVYYASKAFVGSFSEALAFELKGSGVTVTLSCPGPVATEFARIAGNEKSRLFGVKVATPADIAGEAYRAMLEGRPAIVHGLRYKVMHQSLRLSPRAAVLSLAASLNRRAR